PILASPRNSVRETLASRHPQVDNLLARQAQPRRDRVIFERQVLKQARQLFCFHIQSLRDLPEMRDSGEQKEVQSVVGEIEQQSPPLRERQIANFIPQPRGKTPLLNPAVYAGVAVGQHLHGRLGWILPWDRTPNNKVDRCVYLERP